MRKRLGITIFPLITLVSAGYLVGSLFEPIWLRLITGIPTGIGAYFLFRTWGKMIYH